MGETYNRKIDTRAREQTHTHTHTHTGTHVIENGIEIDNQNI